MTQYEFDKILEKYLDGKCTPEEEAAIAQWYNRIEHKGKELLSTGQQTAIKMQIWKRIRASAILKKSWLSISWIRYGAVAASVTLLLWAGWQGGKPLVEPIAELPKTEPIEDIEIKNNSVKPQEINLEDGSLVILQPQSVLSYSENFGKATRTVHLRGDGFFKIKRDPANPFQVLTGKLVTEVLGTSFFIKQKKNTGTIEVEVRSGKVSVYEKTEKGKGKQQAKILTQNQKVTFRADSRQLIPGIVEQPLTATQKPQAEPSAELTFEDAPLQAVSERLEKLYFLDIIIENEDLNHCLFTGDLNGLPLFTQLDLLCKSINARYEIDETQIVVKGVGCNDPE